MRRLRAPDCLTEGRSCLCVKRACGCKRWAILRSVPVCARNADAGASIYDNATSNSTKAVWVEIENTILGQVAIHRNFCIATFESQLVLDVERLDKDEAVSGRVRCEGGAEPTALKTSQLGKYSIPVSPTMPYKFAEIVWSGCSVNCILATGFPWILATGFRKLSLWKMEKEKKNPPSSLGAIIPTIRSFNYCTKNSRIASHQNQVRLMHLQGFYTSAKVCDKT